MPVSIIRRTSACVISGEKTMGITYIYTPRRALALNAVEGGFNPS